MSTNEALGLVLTAILTLAGGFWFFYEKLEKRSNREAEYRERQLKETMRMNHELEKLNDNLMRLIASDEKQNEVLEIHNEHITSLKFENSDHERRIKKVEDTVFRKNRV